jgi:hypothetical protein
VTPSTAFKPEVHEIIPEVHEIKPEVHECASGQTTSTVKNQR